MFSLGRGAMPQDLRISPDGSKFYVADMQAGGVWVLDATGSATTGFIPTGVGTHGIYPSRDGSVLYVTNRGRMMNDLRSDVTRGRRVRERRRPDHRRRRRDTWTIPGGGSPDMGGVSADGSTFWVSGRYDSVVYAFDTTSGALVAEIPVADGPHGLAVFPQPGSYSLGHTGNMR